jgi:hypothetical protein
MRARRALIAGSITTTLAATAFLSAASGVTSTAVGAPAAGVDASPAPLIEAVPAARSVYGLRDSAGHTMETLKVVPDPTSSGRFLGVYDWLSNGEYHVGVATSTDLRSWTWRRTVGGATSQPYLAFSPRKEPVLAVQVSSTSQLRFSFWPSVAKLMGTARPSRVYNAPKTLSTCAEGSPDIRSVTYAGSASTITSGSTIVVGHHYSSGCKTDREAVGTLTNFNRWTTTAASSVDSDLTGAGAVGKHGDRDQFSYGSGRWQLYEGEDSSTATMADWRPYLYNAATSETRQLTVHTAGGSTAFADPSVTVASVNGVPSMIVTLLVPSQGAARGESGELIYWNPLDQAGPSASATPLPSVTTSATPTTTASPTPTITPTPTTTATAGANQVSKVLTFVEENHSLTQMQNGMPYAYSIAKQYGYATNYTATKHPSLPNYIAIASGQTFGISDDNAPSAHKLPGQTVFGQAVANGKTAKTYADGMQSNCALVAGGNRYAVKHNPWAYFTSTAERAACNKYDVPESALQADITAGNLPTVGLVVPNLCNDAHDCSLATADAWFKQRLQAIMAGPDWKSGHLAVVLTADEDDKNSGNKVLTVVIHPSLHGKVVSTSLTHYSYSAFLSHMSGSKPLANAATAPSFATAFGLTIAP